MNSISGQNFTRSAKPPTISAGVMQAKVIWKHDVGIFRDVDVVREGRREGGRVDALQEHLAEAADESLPPVKAIE